MVRQRNTKIRVKFLYIGINSFGVLLFTFGACLSDLCLRMISVGAVDSEVT
jgi:hypothetical protein